MWPEPYFTLDNIPSPESDEDLTPDGWGYRDMTPEEKVQYMNQSHQSGGFDIDHIPNVYYRGICPLTEAEVVESKELLTKSCELALKKYNEEERVNLVLVGVEKANYISIGMYSSYYITFKAKDRFGSSDAELYQAYICYKIPSDDVDELTCRPKPSSPPS